MTTNIITATITAYCACKTCCGPKAKGITASGNKPIQGITIAASRTIPKGSKVTVPATLLPAGQSFNLSKRNGFIVQDRLAKRYDSRFDIYFKRHKDARQFGIKKNQKVIVITP